MQIIDSPTIIATVTGIQDKGTATVAKMRDLLATEDFKIALNPKTIVVSGSSSSQTTIQDAVLNQYASATTQTVSDVLASVPLEGYAIGPITFTSSNTAVATISSSGVVTPVSAGAATIIASVPGLGTRKLSNPVVQSGGEITQTFAKFAIGSLAAHLASNVSSLLTGLIPPSFVGNPPYAYSSLVNLFQPSGMRNTSGWWGGIDTTCIPRSIGTNGVLVTPRDVIFANHFGYSNPTFTDNANNVYMRTVVAASTLIAPTGGGTDILIGTLNADLPASIKPCPLLPANFRTYLPQPIWGYPYVFTNQDRTFLTADIYLITSMAFSPQQSQNILRAPWFYPIRNYDSGSPYFFIINGSLTLISQATGPILSDNIAQMNAAITANGSPYSLTTTSLSGFNTY